MDPDVEAGLREVARERGVSFKEALNSAVSAGLMAPREAREYRTPSRPLGLRPDISLDKALQVAAELEDAEIVHELERGRVKLPDANVLLYALDDTSARHAGGDGVAGRRSVGKRRGRVGLGGPPRGPAADHEARCVRPPAAGR